MILLATLASFGLIGLGVFLGTMIRTGNPSDERSEIVHQRNVVVVLRPRLAELAMARTARRVTHAERSVRG